MSILNAVMMPHPPIILPDIGRGEERKIQSTIDACRAAAHFVAESAPDTVIVLSPHATLYSDWFHLSPGRGARGDFAHFGAPGVRLDVRYDNAFADAITDRAREQNFPAGTSGERDAALDHAAMIPLYFLREAYGGKGLPPIVRIGLSGLPLLKHYRLGMLLRDVSSDLSRQASIIASGDLSHRLKSDGPYGFRTEGPVYDERIMDVMGRAAFGELLNFSGDLCEKAGECGHRSFTIMAGAFDGISVSAERLSYEGPFGVGYGVCLFTPGVAAADRRFYDAAMDAEEEKRRAVQAAEDEYVRLARYGVETFVRTGRAAKLPEGLPEELTGLRAGVFVSLHKDGQLRGCIGTTAPTTVSVAREILQNGVSACARDPRFPPVTERELSDLEYSVDVLGEAENISSLEELDVKRYGVIVTNGLRRGLLLPDLEGVDTVARQIDIARQKAGIGEREEVSLQRFEVVRHV